MDTPKLTWNNHKQVNYLRWYDKAGGEHKNYGDTPEDVLVRKGKLMAKLGMQAREPKSKKTTETKKRFTSVRKAYDKYIASFDDDSSYDGRIAALKPLIEKLGEEDIKKIKVDQLQSVVDNRPTPSTRASCYTFTKAFIRWLWKHDVLRDDISKNLEKPEYTPAVSDDDQKFIEERTDLMSKILNWLAEEDCPFHDDYNRVSCSVMGLRASELGGLCWEEIDERTHAVEIKWQITDDGKNIKNRTKSGFSRFFVIPNPYWERIMDEKSKNRHRSMTLVDKHGKKVKELKHGLVFMQPNGHTINADFSYIRWKRIMASYQEGRVVSVLEAKQLIKDGKVAYFRPHYSRHIAASLMLEAGCTVDEVKEVLGHKSEVNDAIYRHQTAVSSTRLATKMGNALENRQRQAHVATTDATELTEDDMDWMTGSEYGNIDLQTISDIKNGNGTMALAKMLADMKEQLREQAEQNKRLQERNDQLQQQIMMLTTQLAQRLTQQ